jgi:hypothetical protein
MYVPCVCERTWDPDNLMCHFFAYRRSFTFVQLLFRQEARDLSQRLPKRGLEQLRYDAVKRSQPGRQFPFSVFEGDAFHLNCSDFLAMDSSLTVLELMGALPGPDDLRDSDAVLTSRMKGQSG